MTAWVAPRRSVISSFNTIKDWRDLGFHMRQPPMMLACYDPAGDGTDRDALVLLAREEHQKGEPHDPDFGVVMMFRVLMAHRLSPDLEFPDKLAQLLRLHRELAGWQGAGKAHQHVFCVETNGVGYAMGSSLRSKLGNRVLTYTTVGNSRDDPYTDKKLSMPRLASLDNLRVLAETHSLKLARDAPGRELLVREMSSFVWRRPGRPEALEGQHDDLVMALAGGCWMGTRVLPPILRAKVYNAAGRRRLH